MRNIAAVRIFIFAALCLLSIPSLDAQWNYRKTDKLCKAVDKEDWSKVHKRVRKHIVQWKYLDTSLGYHDYTGAIDSLVSIFQAMPCVEDAFADKCAMKIAIWPGTSVLGVQYILGDGIYEFCYTIQQGKMRSIGIDGILKIPLKGKEKLVFKGFGRCEGFVEEQRQICVEEE